MDISVVIATYNRKNILEKCLECLFNQDYPKDKYEIVVVDDGSTDGTKQMIEKKTTSCSLQYLRHPERKGPSKARNLGIAHSRGEVIVFIDSDILTPPQFLREHMRYHKKSNNLIVDGPAISIQEKEATHPPFFSFKTKFLSSLDLFGGCFITANTSCRKKNLIKAGGFDEDFDAGFGWEDKELGFRLKKMGLKRKKNQRAYALHVQQEKSRENFYLLNLRKKMIGENAILYYKKHPLPEVRREIKFHHIYYDQILCWFVKWKTLSVTSSKGGNKSPISPLSTKLYFIHSYAEGLKKGAKKYKVEIK